MPRNKTRGTSVWFAGLAIFVRTIVAPLQRYGWLLDAVAGGVFVLLGAWMAVEGLLGIAQ